MTRMWIRRDRRFDDWRKGWKIFETSTAGERSIVVQWSIARFENWSPVGEGRVPVVCSVAYRSSVRKEVIVTGEDQGADALARDCGFQLSIKNPTRRKGRGE